MSANILTRGASADRAGEIVNVGNKSYICAYWSGSGALALGKPCNIFLQADVALDGYMPQALAPATTALANVLIGLPYVAIAASTPGWYWFQIKGLANAYVLGAASVGPGVTLKVSNGGTNFAVDSTASTPSTGTSAIMKSALYTTTSAALKSVWLPGVPSQI